MKFRLIGRTNIFTVSRFYSYLGISCVEGVTEINGKSFVTRTRIEDVIFLGD